jgi:putative oxidoreductase
MSRRWSYLAPLIGRILIGGFFIWNSLQEVINFPATTDIFIHMGLPNPTWWAGAAVALEALGGIALITNTKSRLAALVLALYIAASSATLVSTGSLQTQLFIENLAIMGGLLVLSA